MPPPSEDNVSLGELSRRLSEVFVRFEALAQRLEGGQFVRTELFTARQEAVNIAIAALQEQVRNMEKDYKAAVAEAQKSIDTKVGQSDLKFLVERVAQLEDDKKWLVRLVLAFIILGVLGAVFVASGGAPK